MWGEEAFGLPIHDNWWQTETGGIMIANYACDGRSSPARWAGRCRASRRRSCGARDDGGVDGRSREPDVEGELALQARLAVDVPRLLQRRGALPQVLRRRLVPDRRSRRRDADGYFWFVGRADDVIKSAGHLIGPFEVESALMEHPAVAEAGVIGKPDPVAGEIVKAFVALKAGYAAERGAAPRAARHSRASASARRWRRRRSTFLADLPRTRSGKIMRRLLQGARAGLPEGDLSTLEGAA